MSPQELETLFLTLRLAAVSTVALLLVSTPLAWWLSRTRSRWKPPIEAVVALPLVLPPTVLGFYLLLAMGPHAPLGRAYEALTGARLPFSFAGILLGSVLYNLPFAVRPFSAAFAAVDRRLIEAAWCCGVSRFATFRRVTAPLAWPGILAGVVLTFAHTVGEFGVVLMIGGSIPGRTQVISIAIYQHVEALEYGAAHALAAGMLLFSFAVLIVVYAFGRRFETPRL